MAQPPCEETAGDKLAEAVRNYFRFVPRIFRAVINCSRAPRKQLSFGARSLAQSHIPREGVAMSNQLDLSDSLSAKRQQLSDVEKGLRDKIKRGEKVSKNVNDIHDRQLTVGERLADQLADVAGSWNFILSFLGLVLLWIGINSFLLLTRPWDPYPFILLNLILSLLAGIQAPVIMMSQNRQESKDRIRAEHDYEVNLKAEMEIESLHEKIDTLRETQWAALVAMQQQQIALLEKQVEMLQDLAKKA